MLFCIVRLQCREVLQDGRAKHALYFVQRFHVPFLVRLLVESVVAIGTFVTTKPCVLIMMNVAIEPLRENFVAKDAGVYIAAPVHVVDHLHRNIVQVPIGKGPTRHIQKFKDCALNFNNTFGR